MTASSRQPNDRKLMLASCSNSTAFPELWQSLLGAGRKTGAGSTWSPLKTTRNPSALLLLIGDEAVLARQLQTDQLSNLKTYVSKVRPSTVGRGSVALQRLLGMDKIFLAPYPFSNRTGSPGHAYKLVLVI